MEQRANQLAALTLEDEEEDKKEVRMGGWWGVSSPRDSASSSACRVSPAQGMGERACGLCACTAVDGFSSS